VLKNTSFRILFVFSILLSLGHSKPASAQFFPGSEQGDYVVVFYHQQGEPNCWRLENKELTLGLGYVKFENEEGHEISLYGVIGIAKVKNKDFASAAKNFGVKEELCLNGKYPDMTIVEEEKKKPR